MPITDYTSYDQIRAVLGVSLDEITDTTLALEVYDTELDYDLSSLSATLASEYAVIAAKLPVDRTTDETEKYITTRVYSTYSVAKTLLYSLPMFAPQSISDGKAKVSRFSNSPLDMIRQNVIGQYEKWKRTLLGVISGSGSASITSRPYMDVGIPASDPVTGT